MRTTDRVEAWAILMLFVTLVAAVYPAFLVGDVASDARLRSLAADVASRHEVGATAMADSSAQPSLSESGETTFVVDARWVDDGVTSESAVKVDGPVRMGERVSVWLTDEGKVTTPTADDVQLMRLGSVALAWSTMALAAAAAFAVLRRKLTRARDLRWDRSWREYAGNGGGSTTITP